MIPPIASNFVAGETPAEALDHVRDVNEQGAEDVLNRLGDHHEERPPADVDACVSVKPSQIGLDVSDHARSRRTSDRIARPTVRSGQPR